MERAAALSHAIIAETRMDLPSFSVGEAVMQMELVDDNFLVFSNSRTNSINVLYRRKDGHYGLIQPS